MSPVYAILPDWSGFPRRALLQIAIIGHIIILISVPVDSLSIWCWQDVATTGYRRTPDIFNGRSHTTCSPVDRPVDVYFGRWLLHQKKKTPRRLLSSVNQEPAFSYDPAALPQNRSTRQCF